MSHDDLDIYRSIAEAIQSSQSIVSWLQLSRRLRLQDDKMRRSWTRLEQRVGKPLMRIDNRRFLLTDAGVGLLNVAQLFADLCRDEARPDETEQVVVELHPAVDARLVMNVCGRLVTSWDEMVSLRLISISEMAVERVLNRSSSFAIVVDEARAMSHVEWSECRVRWAFTFLQPLPERTSDVLPEELIADRKIFVSNFGFAGIMTHLKSLSCSAVIECASLAEVTEAVRSGLGVGCIPRFCIEPVESSALWTLPVPNVEALHVGLLLPKQQDRLNEAALWLVEEFRQAILAALGPTETSSSAMSLSPDDSALTNGSAIKSHKRKNLQESS